MISSLGGSGHPCVPLAGVSGSFAISCFAATGTCTRMIHTLPGASSKFNTSYVLFLRNVWSNEKNVRWVFGSLLSWWVFLKLNEILRILLDLLKLQKLLFSFFLPSRFSTNSFQLKFGLRPNPVALCGGVLVTGFDVSV